MRANSTLYRFRCNRCGERVVAKLAPLRGSRADTGQLIEREYERLLTLQSVLLPDSQCGTLTPVGHLEVDGYGAMVTRLFRGDDLIRCTRSAGVDELCQLYRRAGALLRALHDACPRVYPAQALDVGPKLAYLTKTYGAALHRSPATCSALARLQESALRTGAWRLRQTWGHGDFKPENVLYDGRKLVVLDTTLDIHGAFVYDIASFLDHLWLAGRSFYGGAIRRNFQLVETEFLAGYGKLDPQGAAALRWAQLYFALCYFGGYGKRSAALAVYARRRITPLVRTLTTQLMYG